MIIFGCIAAEIGRRRPVGRQDRGSRIAEDADVERRVEPEADLVSDYPLDRSRDALVSIIAPVAEMLRIRTSSLW